LKEAKLKAQNKEYAPATEYEENGEAKKKILPQYDDEPLDLNTEGFRLDSMQ